ncbi:hypothetical protein NC653_030573 [Populus alba x Populus x berolinensis]|uniref:Uncharacterized protein n=1 Tax=Populus alba x Populus x berolinensis TaxID=444605 RepID=A0AAD6Q0E2_9ROSI|nr:hypothetical protein NC653_030573 [Populus alba x Populus x berolinensis]
MPRAIHYKPQPLLSKSSPLLNPFGEMTFTDPKSKVLHLKLTFFTLPFTFTQDPCPKTNHLCKKE